MQLTVFFLLLFSGCAVPSKIYIFLLTLQASQLYSTKWKQFGWNTFRLLSAKPFGHIFFTLSPRSAITKDLWDKINSANHLAGDKLFSLTTWLLQLSCDWDDDAVRLKKKRVIVSNVVATNGDLSLCMDSCCCSWSELSDRPLNLRET